MVYTCSRHYIAGGGETALDGVIIGYRCAATVPRIVFWRVRLSHGCDVSIQIWQLRTTAWGISNDTRLFISSTHGLEFGLAALQLLL